jgi:hypothetical protein
MLASVTARSYPGRTFEGKVTVVYPQVNKQTRTVQVRIELPNDDLALLPDMYVDAEIGIGGSALGTIALRSALLDPFWNELDSAERDFFPRLYVLDNVDPHTFGTFLRRVDLRRTLFNVVSKSGGTAETMGQFMIVRQMLEADGGGAERSRAKSCERMLEPGFSPSAIKPFLLRLAAPPGGQLTSQLTTLSRAH